MNVINPTEADVKAATEAERLVMRSPIGWAASLQDLFAAARAEGRAEGVKAERTRLALHYRAIAAELVASGYRDTARRFENLAAELEKKPT